MPPIPGHSETEHLVVDHGWRAVNRFGCQKIEAVGAALKLGYDVVYSDIDVIVLEDPLPYLFHPNIDHSHSSNKECGKEWKFNGTMEVRIH